MTGKTILTDMCKCNGFCYYTGAITRSDGDRA